MCQEILDFARDEIKTSPTPLILPEFCQELANTALEGLGVRVIYTCQLEEGVSPTMLLDKDKIWRVMMNLIGNAKDAMPEGGEVRLRLHMNQQEARLEVEDTGIGIPEKIRDRLFRPFVTHGKTRGTGLGLAIVKRIVEAHGGTITFITAEGVGTTFYVTLPRRMAAKLEVGSAGTASTEDQKRRIESTKV